MKGRTRAEIPVSTIVIIAIVVLMAGLAYHWFVSLQTGAKIKELEKWDPRKIVVEELTTSEIVIRNGNEESVRASVYVNRRFCKEMNVLSGVVSYSIEECNVMQGDELMLSTPLYTLFVGKVERVSGVVALSCQEEALSGSLLDINVRLFNASRENSCYFKVYLFVDSPENGIGSFETSLNSGESELRVLSWDSSGFVGSHKIKGRVSTCFGDYEDETQVSLLPHTLFRYMIGRAEAFLTGSYAGEIQVLDLPTQGQSLSLRILPRLS